MHRRSLMALLGLAPVAAVSGGESAAFAPAPSSLASGITSSPPLAPNGILRAAFKAGLIDRDTLAAALEKESYRSIDYEATVERYKAFSPLAKRRLIEQAKRERALYELLDGGPVSFWDLVRKFEGKV